MHRKRFKFKTISWNCVKILFYKKNKKLIRLKKRRIKIPPDVGVESLRRSFEHVFSTFRILVRAVKAVWLRNLLLQGLFIEGFDIIKYNLCARFIMRNVFVRNLSFDALLRLLLFWVMREFLRFQVFDVRS